jgi:putative ATP-binding cassette transporter
MNELIRVIKPIRIKLIVAIIAGTVGGLSSAGLLAVIADTLVARGSTESVHGLTYFLLCILMVAGRAASGLLVVRLGQAVTFHLRLRLSQLIVDAPFRRLQIIGSPRLLANLTDDVATIAAAFEAAPWICVNLAVVIGCLAYLAFLSTAFFWVILAILLIGVLSFLAVKGYALRALAAARVLNDRLHRHFRSLTDGIKELKLNTPRRQSFFASLLEPTAREYQKEYELGTSFVILAGHWGSALFYLTIGLVLFVFPLGHDGNTEAVAGYVLVVLYMSGPISALLDAAPALSRAKISFARLDLLEHDLDRTENEHYDFGSDQVSAAQIELREVIHRYQAEGEDESFTLGPLSLVLSPGELVFIIGGNGTGKTTLALILVGLYVPDSGEIRLNGDVVTSANRSRYREHFSAVFSDCHVFGGIPVADRLSAEDGQRYLKHFQLDHKVKLTDGSFSTIELSEGQRKRLALLSAYLEDRPCYVFDEWAANQDPVFKNLFYTTLLPDLKARGKTIVVITHDDQYYYVADRCIRLKQPQELMPVLT